MKTALGLLFLLALSFCGCATTSTSSAKMDAVCYHPLMNNGQPFSVAPNATLVGDRIYHPDGKSFITGAQCLFIPAEPTAATGQEPSSDSSFDFGQIRNR